MKRRTCAAFLFEGFADHELSLVMAGVNRDRNYCLETFTVRGRVVTAASGLRVMPHASLGFMNPEDFDLLLLPGGGRPGETAGRPDGDQWEKGENLEIFPLILASIGKRPVMAVGSAILALADLGILDDIPHTGHCPEYFKRYCPEYRGEPFYCGRPLVSAGGIVTIDSNALADPAVFDTLQEIYPDDHELLDPALYAERS